MLFRRHRIKRLRRMVRVQKAVVNLVRGYAENSSTSYYADRHISEHAKLCELEATLAYLLL